MFQFQDRLSKRSNINAKSHSLRALVYSALMLLALGTFTPPVFAGSVTLTEKTVKTWGGLSSRRVYTLTAAATCPAVGTVAVTHIKVKWAASVKYGLTAGCEIIPLGGSFEIEADTDATCVAPNNWFSYVEGRIAGKWLPFSKKWSFVAFLDTPGPSIIPGSTAPGSQNCSVDGLLPSHMGQIAIIYQNDNTDPNNSIQLGYATIQGATVDVPLTRPLTQDHFIFLAIAENQSGDALIVDQYPKQIDLCSDFDNSPPECAAGPIMVTPNAETNSTITLPSLSCNQISSFTFRVALSHPNASDLQIELTSPSLTTVTLKEFGGPTLPDIYTIFDQRGEIFGPSQLSEGHLMQPSGPGSIDDFSGDCEGDWTLTVTSLSNDPGIIHDWCILPSAGLPISSTLPPTGHLLLQDQHSGYVQDIAVSLNLSHANIDNMQIRLIYAPTSEVIILFTGGTSNASLNGTYVFTNFANETITQAAITPGTAVPEGSYLSVSSLDALRDQGASAQWIIELEDLGGSGEVGLLEYWCLTLAVHEIAPPPMFKRGDCNTDNQNNIADAINLLGFIFPAGGFPSVLQCVDACDANDDNQINIADAIALLGSIFGAPVAPLPAPFPNCGVDTTGTQDCDFGACP